MDPTLLAAASGFLGALVGGAASLAAQALSGRTQRHLAEAQDGRRHAREDAAEQRRELRELYAERRRAVDDFQALIVDAYRGGAGPAAIDERRLDVLALRSHVMFAFGDERFANEVAASVLSHEEENVREKATGTVSGAKLKAASDEMQRLNAEMMRATNETRAALGLPTISVRARLVTTTPKENP